MGINIEQYSNLPKEEFEVEIITPLFLGGADKVKSEIRPASIKGAIRFWWRALYGYKFDSIEEMAEQEGLIFGSTEMKSSFSIIVDESLISKSSDLKKVKTLIKVIFLYGLIKYYLKLMIKMILKLLIKRILQKKFIKNIRKCQITKKFKPY